MNCHDWFVSLKPYQHHLRALGMRCFQIWWCRNRSPAWLFQYRLQLQTVSFQNTTDSHALEWVPGKPVSEGSCVLRVFLSPCPGSYPFLELFLGTWLQSGCQSNETIRGSKLEICFSSTFCVRKQYEIDVLLYLQQHCCALHVCSTLFWGS